MQGLNAASVTGLPEHLRPQYDRTRIDTGIVHIGVGGFHRSHEAMYVDRLLAAGITTWGIAGVGTQPADRRMHHVMAKQDGLYTLVLKHPNGEIGARILGSIVDYRYAPDDPATVVAWLAAPTTKVVSLTITEGGYPVDIESRAFKPTETSVFATISAGLAERRARGAGPLTVMSCDNLPGNGEVAQAAVVGSTALVDPALADWVRANVAFPNSMVDRITPATTDADVKLVADTLGIVDEWPVVAEPFHQWVLEETPGVERPPWEDVGVQIVPDVLPYELMKLRLLNAGHQAIGYLGVLAGYEYADEVCADPVFRKFLIDYMELEGAPTLPPVPGVNLDDYRHTLVARFANRQIRDPLARLCVDSTDRISTWLVPVITEQLRSGGSVARSALVVAGWAKYALGVDEHGDPIVVVDRLLETVRLAADAQRTDPAGFLTRIPALRDLAREPRFVETFTAHMRSLHSDGARAAVARLDGTA